MSCRLWPLGNYWRYLLTYDSEKPCCMDLSWKYILILILIRVNPQSTGRHCSLRHQYIPLYRLYPPSPNGLDLTDTIGGTSGGVSMADSTGSSGMSLSRPAPPPLSGVYSATPGSTGTASRRAEASWGSGLAVFMVEALHSSVLMCCF